MIAIDKTFFDSSGDHMTKVNIASNAVPGSGCHEAKMLQLFSALRDKLIAEIVQKKSNSGTHLS